MLTMWAKLGVLGIVLACVVDEEIRACVGILLGVMAKKALYYSMFAMK
jgi:hypothetical protein